MEIWLEESQATVRRTDGTAEKIDEVLMCSSDARRIVYVLSKPIVLRSGDSVSIQYEET